MHSRRSRQSHGQRTFGAYNPARPGIASHPGTGWIPSIRNNTQSVQEWLLAWPFGKRARSRRSRRSRDRPNTTLGHALSEAPVRELLRRKVVVKPKPATGLYQACNAETCLKHQLQAKLDLA